MDIVPEFIGKLRDDGGRNGCATGIDLRDARQFLPPRGRVVHHGDEDGDGADGEFRFVLLDGVHHHPGLEPVAQDQGCGGGEGGTNMPDEPGDMEKRSHAKNRPALAQFDPILVTL